MSGAQTAAGTKIFIGDAMPSTLDEIGYEGVAWVEISDVTDIPEHGKDYETVTHNPIGTRRTEKRKGAYNEGEVTLQMARVPSDEGQQALQAAVDLDDTFPFKIEESGGAVSYFGAQVMSYTKNIGTVNNIKQAASRLEITTEILEVEPA